MEKPERKNSNVWNDENSSFQFQSSIVWKRKTPELQSFAERQNLEFQCVEKPKFTIPIFGKAKNKNSNDWNRQNSYFRCLEMPKLRISMFEKAQNLQFQCLEKPKFRIPMFGKAKNKEFQ